MLRITGRNVPKDALTGADIKGLTGKDVRDNSLDVDRSFFIAAFC